MEKHFLKKLITLKIILSIILLPFFNIKYSYAFLPVVAVPVAESIASAVIANASRRAAVTVAEQIWVRQKVATLVASSVGTATVSSSRNVLGGIAGALGLTFLLKSSTGLDLSIGATATTVTSLTISNNQRPTSSPLSTIQPGATVWAEIPSSAISPTNPLFADPFSLIVYIAKKQNWSYSYDITNCRTLNSSTYLCDLTAPGRATLNVAAQKYFGTITASCLFGQAYNGSCIPSPTQDPVITPIQTQTQTVVPYSDDISPFIPTQYMPDTITPQTIADVSNQIYDKITQTPAPFPTYDPVNPVLPTDVLQTPTIEDFVRPIPATQLYPSPTSSGDPSTIPNSTEQTITPTQPSHPERPPPTVGLPRLEQTPTIAQILGPIFNLMPGLRNFDVPPYQTQCPILVIDFEFMGKPFYSAPSYHCNLMGDYRQVIRTAAIVVATITVVFILIGAA